MTVSTTVRHNTTHMPPELVHRAKQCVLPCQKGPFYLVKRPILQGKKDIIMLIGVGGEPARGPHGRIAHHINEFLMRDGIVIDCSSLADAPRYVPTFRI